VAAQDVAAAARYTDLLDRVHLTVDHCEPYEPDADTDWVVTHLPHVRAMNYG
jgi:hypothetical protein